MLLDLQWSGFSSVATENGASILFTFPNALHSEVGSLYPNMLCLFLKEKKLNLQQTGSKNCNTLQIPPSTVFNIKQFRE